MATLFSTLAKSKGDKKVSFYNGDKREMKLRLKYFVKMGGKENEILY
jgi:hypothetical protein